MLASNVKINNCILMIGWILHSYTHSNMSITVQTHIALLYMMYVFYIPRPVMGFMVA